MNLVYKGISVKKLKFSGLIMVFLLLTQLAFAAPKKDLWPVWEANNSQSKLTVDNHIYQEFLTKYIHSDSSGMNLVAYSQVSTSDKAQLENYINYLATIKISQYNRNEQLAYWANLYNADLRRRVN